MNKRVIKVIFFLFAIILGFLVGSGLKTSEEMGRQNQSMTNPVPKPPIDPSKL